MLDSLDLVSYVGDSWVCCSLKLSSSVVWAFGVDLCSLGWAFGVDLTPWFDVDLLSLVVTVVDLSFLVLSGVNLNLSLSGADLAPLG